MQVVGRPGSSAAAAGVLSWLTADVAAASNLVKPRIKGGVITPLPAAKPTPASAKPPPLPAAAAVAAPDSLAVAATHASASGCDVIELPAAGSAAAAAGDCEDHSEVWLDVKFTLVEPRVKGGAVMARAGSHPRRSSRLGCDSPTTAAAAAAAALTDDSITTCSSSSSQSGSAAYQLSAARAVDVWSLDAAIRPRKPAWQFPGGARTSFNMSSSNNVQLQELQPNDAVLHPRQGLGVMCFESGLQQQQQPSGSSSSSSGRAGLRELLLAARSNRSARYGIEWGTSMLLLILCC
jgi:hypothetical protein